MEPLLVQAHTQPTTTQIQQGHHMMENYRVFWGIPIDAIRVDKSLEKCEQATKKLEELGFYVTPPESGYNLLIYNSREGIWHSQSHLMSSKVITVESLLDECWKKFYA